MFYTYPVVLGVWRGWCCPLSSALVGGRVSVPASQWSRAGSVPGAARLVERTGHGLGHPNPRSLVTRVRKIKVKNSGFLIKKSSADAGSTLGTRRPGLVGRARGRWASSRELACPQGQSGICEDSPRLWRPTTLRQNTQVPGNRCENHGHPLEPALLP